MSLSIRKILAVFIGITAISQSALADVFTFEDLAASNGGISDKLDSVTGTFNDVTNQFTWDVEFNADPTDVDGFWLVVNNGPNPKSSDVNELAIMYGDLNANILTTYVYNGLNNANSWDTPGIYLQSDTITSDSNSFSIDLDATAINAWGGAPPEYTGIAFDENIGIWFHISTGSDFDYVGDLLDGYSWNSQGWYDKENLTTTVSAPEPATLSLLLLGIAGLFSRNRKRMV